MNVLPEHREILAKLKPHLGRHILTGPVHVEGAERGDVLAVEVLDIKFRTNWGWNVQRPLMGTLPEDFPFYQPDAHPDRFEPRRLHHAVGPRDPAQAVLRHHGRGAAAEWGQCSSVEPRAFGGNIDNKHFQVGTTVYFPVFADGGLFSTGDGHGVQGDGEVNLTALETSLSGTFNFTVRKDMKLNNPRAETATHWITHGFDPDLDDAAKEALRDMIRLITAKTGLKPAGRLHAVQPAGRPARHPDGGRQQGHPLHDREEADRRLSRSGRLRRRSAAAAGSRREGERDRRRRRGPCRSEPMIEPAVACRSVEDPAADRRAQRHAEARDHASWRRSPCP